MSQNSSKKSVSFCLQNCKFYSFNKSFSNKKKKKNLIWGEKTNPKIKLMLKLKIKQTYKWKLFADFAFNSTIHLGFVFLFIL